MLCVIDFLETAGFNNVLEFRNTSFYYFYFESDIEAIRALLSEHGYSFR